MARWTRRWTLAAVAFAAGLGVTVGIDRSGGLASAGWPSVSLGTGVAQAQPARRMTRRTARRTARRTSARMNYYNSLPAGCVLRGPYHYCGGVYYDQIVRDGATVYVVVTP